MSELGSTHRVIPHLPPPQHRLVLLGASNLVRSFPALVSIAQQVFPGPLEIMVAMGHGRSFGRCTSVFGRKISGISQCRLWEDLGRRPPLPTSAVVTDIGNDLLYGEPLADLFEWVETCLAQLSAAGAETVIAQLPREPIERLDRARFLLFRTAFFPRSRLTLAAAKQLKRDLDRHLAELASRQKTPLIYGKNEWYGYDPIHFRYRFAGAAWADWLGHFSIASADVALSRVSLSRAAYLRLLPPWERSIFGLARRRAQPSGALSDGTTLSLY